MCLCNEYNSGIFGMIIKREVDKNRDKTIKFKLKSDIEKFY